MAPLLPAHWVHALPFFRLDWLALWESHPLLATAAASSGRDRHGDNLQCDGCGTDGKLEERRAGSNDKATLHRGTNSREECVFEMLQQIKPFYPLHTEEPPATIKQESDETLLEQTPECVCDRRDATTTTTAQGARSSVVLDVVLCQLLVREVRAGLVVGLASVRRARDPLARLARGRLLEHAVDLLERETLGLWDEEVRIDEGTRAEGAPEEEDGRTEVGLVGTDKVRSDDGDDRVPEPVRGRRERNTSGSDGEREDLANENPSTRAPGRSKEEDEDGNEGDLGIDGANVLGNRDTGGVGSELQDGGEAAMSATGNGNCD